MNARYADRPIAVFSDLDGTLLDDCYRWDEAATVLGRLHSAGIPLVLASSKTRLEMLALGEALAPGQPLIFENGCGITMPSALGSVERFGPDYASLRSTVVTLRRRLGIDVRGFGDMDDEEVARRTGLPLADAALARKREASEPGVLSGPGDVEQRFANALDEQGLRLVLGGRFQHVMPRADKATAMDRVAAELAAVRGVDRMYCIAAGDSANDADMLHAADEAIVVRRHDGSWLHLDRQDGVRHSRAIGPAGWAECMSTLLDELGVPRSSVDHPATEATP